MHHYLQCSSSRVLMDSFISFTMGSQESNLLLYLNCHGIFVCCWTFCMHIISELRSYAMKGELNCILLVQRLSFARYLVCGLSLAAVLDMWHTASYVVHTNICITDEMANISAFNKSWLFFS